MGPVPAPTSFRSVRMRAADAADVRAVAEFQTRCWREAYRGLVPQEYLDRVTAADREVRWRERIAGARQVGLAEAARERSPQRESGGGVVGAISWGTTEVPVVPALELKSLYVDREHRGTGLADALLRWALGDEPAHLWVFDNNPRASAFYSKQGFTADGHVRTDPDTGLPEQRLVRR